MSIKRFTKLVGAAIVAVVFVTIGGCAAQTQTERAQAKADRKEAAQRFNESIARRNQEMFKEPPLTGEIVLSTFQEKVEKRKNISISLEEANAFNTSRIMPDEYTIPEFSSREVATIFFKKAVKQFPDIDIEDLDVRSLAPVGDVKMLAAVNPYPIPLSNPPKYTLNIIEELVFRGTVVKRATTPNIEQPAREDVEQEQLNDIEQNDVVEQEQSHDMGQNDVIEDRMDTEE